MQPSSLATSPAGPERAADPCTLPDALRRYLLSRRAAILGELAEIERTLNLPRTKPSTH